MGKKIKRKITINLEIDLNDTTEDEMDWGLDNAISHLYADGWFTGGTSAELDEWNYHIE